MNRSAPPDASREATRIARGLKIVGTITGSCELFIDGEVEGEVRLEHDVTIGGPGELRGDVFARSIRVGGRVYGNVRGSSRVEILPTGRVEGDVSAPKVVLAEGAFFRGKVEMSGESRRQESRPEVAEKASSAEPESAPSASAPSKPDIRPEAEPAVKPGGEPPTQSQGGRKHEDRSRGAAQRTGR